MAKDSDIPAWMVCEEALTRLKDELVLEAIDILHQEVKAGRIDINGYVSLLPDKPDEIQRDMYIINNLRMKEHEIMEQYGHYMQQTDEKNPHTLSRIESLRKFLLSVRAISTLMHFSEIVGAWADDTGRYPKESEISVILEKTARSSADRLEVLDFVLSSTKFIKNQTLDGRELGALRKARNAIA